MNRSIVLALAGTWLASCAQCAPPSPSADAGPCIDDSECPGFPFYRCSLASGECRPGCAQTADCHAHPAAGGGPLPECGGLGCVCDLGTCAPRACSADVDCGGGQACLGGACEVRPPPARCRLDPAFTPALEGEALDLTPLFFDAQGHGLAGAFVLGSRDAHIGVAGPTRLVARTAHAPSEAPTVVFASPSGDLGVVCTALVHVYPPAAGNLRVVVVDELTRRPLTGATVEVVGGAAPVATDARGAAAVAAAPSPAVVTVAHTDYDYVTIAGVSARDLLVPLRRTRGTRWGGMTADLAGLLSKSAEVHLALGGLSLPGSLADLAAADLVGTPERIDVQLGGSTVPMDVTSAMAGAIGGGTAAKSRALAFGIAGECDGPDADRLTSGGECATRIPWTLIGDLPMSKVPFGTYPRPDFAFTLFAEAFAQSSTRGRVLADLPFRLRPGDAPALDDAAAFPTAAFADPLPMGLRTLLAIPRLPIDADLNAALVLGGVSIRGRGIVPLGITGARNGVPADGQIDGVRPGVLPLRMLAAHSGLEAQPFRVVAMALDSRRITALGATATSVLIAPVPWIAAMGADDGVPPMGFAREFLAVPATTFAYDTAVGRPQPVAGAALQRLVFEDARSRRWVVYHRGDADVAVPPPPAGFDDRTMWHGAPRAPPTPARHAPPSRFQAQALQAATTLETMFDFTAPPSFRHATAMDGITALATQVIAASARFDPGLRCLGGASSCPAVPNPVVLRIEPGDVPPGMHLDVKDPSGTVRAHFGRTTTEESLGPLAPGTYRFELWLVRDGAAEPAVISPALDVIERRVE